MTFCSAKEDFVSLCRYVFVCSRNRREVFPLLMNRFL